MNKVSGFFQSFDMFAAPATLRARGSSSIARTSTGVISFVLFCYFAYIFIIGLYRIFTFNSITSSPSFQKIPINKIYGQNFMFGVGDPQQDPSYLTTLYTIKVAIISTKFGIIENITMLPCQPQQWAQLGDDYEYQFKQHYLDKFLCPQSPQKIKLVNSTIIGNATFFQILIQPHNSTLKMQSSRQEQYTESHANKFSLFFLDQAVIPNSQKSIQYFVNINHFAYVSPYKEHNTLLRLSNTKISTDYSVIPLYQDYHVEQGRFIADAVITEIDSQSALQYSKITFQLTNDLFIYNRKVGKIDEMFSYAGGLFALFIWCLAFFVANFNSHRYVLMVAETIFNFDKDGNKFRENDFNFAKYIKYSLYLWISYYFCYKPNWEDCQKIQLTLKQANNQMDVTRLFRKLQFFQMALIHTTNQSQNMLVALTQPRSLGEVKEERLILEYYFAIIGGEPAATVEDAKDGNANRFPNLKESHYNKSKKQKKSPKKQSLLEESSRQALFVSQDEIKQKLMKYLQLEQFQETCKAIGKYPVALQQAKDTVLSKQLEAVEEHLTIYFLKLRPMAKAKIIQRIPLKIIHRLCLKSQQMQQRYKRDAMEEQLNPKIKKVD